MTFEGARKKIKKNSIGRLAGKKKDSIFAPSFDRRIRYLRVRIRIDRWVFYRIDFILKKI